MKSDKCTKSVDGEKYCIYCLGRCVKNGLTRDKKQRFLCRTCRRSSLWDYRNAACRVGVDHSIVSFVKEGCGIRSIARLLKISVATVLKRIKRIAKKIKQSLSETGKEYEMDELCTFIGCKASQIWVSYAIQKENRKVVAFVVGNRSNKTLSVLTEKLLSSYPEKIYTDKLLQYKSLIPPLIHCTKKYGINHIERKNLTLSTHLKRLSRRTICFSRSIEMLRACLLIYFFS